MKYEILHSCGHVATVQLYGKTELREKKRQSLEKEICDECFEKQETQKDEAKGYPELTGSQKEINWAKKLRRKQFEAIEAKLEKYKNHPQKNEAEKFKKFLLTLTDSRVFINCEISITEPGAYFMKLYKEQL